MTALDAAEADLLRAKAGDRRALVEPSDRNRDRLRRMVRLRLDRRMLGRVDPADVLQGAYPDVARRFGEHAASPAPPFYVRLRSLAGQRLIDLHRRHLGAGGVALPQRTAGGVGVAGAAAAGRAETRLRLQEAINAPGPIDREELSNDEAAGVLGIEPAAASRRYIRAIRRLKAVPRAVPGLFG